MLQISRSTFPFNRLPTELKMNIFNFDALVVDRIQRNRQNLRTRAMKLSLVCREWREIVCSMSHLWSSIYINFCFFDFNVEVFHIYIKNSKNHPLDISITLEDHDINVQEGSQILADLRRDAHRIKILDVSFGTLHPDHEIYSNMNQLVGSYMPLLEEVELSREHDDDELYVSLGAMFRNSPRLRDMTIGFLGPTDLSSCQHITTLKLQGVSVYLWIYALVYLPNLTHVTIDGYKPWVTDPEIPDEFRFEDGSSVFIHTSLTSIELIVDDIDYSEDTAILLLRSISCPSLNKLLVRNYGSEDENDVLAAVIALLTASNCPLKDLRLEMDRSRSNIWPLFDCVHTTVESLYLETNRSPSDFIPNLVNKLSSPSYFQQILNVQIFERSGPLDYTTIYRQLKQRLDSWPAGTEIQPLMFNVVLYYPTKPDQDAKESANDDGISDEIDIQEIVDGLKDLKERGMELSFNVRSERFGPHPFLQRYIKEKAAIYYY